MANFQEKVAAIQGGIGPTEKRAKFVILAEKRTINAIRAVRTLATLGNRAKYEYDNQDVEKILSALNAEIDYLKARMRSPGARDDIKFKL